MGKINFIKGQRPTPNKSFDGVYNDGGEVAEKIKERLAKGSFELPMEMIVYVPSTKDGNVIISKSDFQARVKSVRAYLATKFGGFSSNPTDGGYMSNDNKGLIEEDVVKVTAFATKEALEENLDALLKKIQSWCRAWSQESIGFEFEGDLFYISAISKFMSGGRTKFVGGGEAEDQDNRTMIMRQAKEVSHHVEELNEILSKQPDIDAWVVAKMQDVTTQLSEITHYLDSRVGFRLGGDDIQAVQDSMLKDGGEIILGGGNMASVQDAIMARGGKVMYNNGGGVKNKIKYPIGYIAFLQNKPSRFTKVMKILEKYGIEIDNSKDFHTKGYAEELYGQNENGQEMYIIHFDIRDASNPQQLKKEISDLENQFLDVAVQYHTDSEYANGGMMKYANGGGVRMYKKVRTLNDIKNDPRVSEVYSDNSTGELVWWMYLESGFISDWDDASTITCEDTIQYLKDSLNTDGAIITIEEYNKIHGIEKAAKGAKLKSGKLTLSKLKSMIEEYNSEGRSFELLGAYNQLELWSKDNRIEAGSKEDIYRALVRYRYNPKYADGAELHDLNTMSDEEIITFANTLSYYDRMDEGIEEEFDNVEDAKEYLRMIQEQE